MFDTVDIVQLINTTFDVVELAGGKLSTSEHDSLIIWPETNTFFWYSKRIGGGPYQWMKDVLVLPYTEMDAYVEELEEFVPPAEELEFMLRYPVGNVGYNSYIKSRNVTMETANRYRLEVWGENVIIPMYGIRGFRAGSLVRRYDTDIQWLKYRKYQSSEICNLWPYTDLSTIFDKPVFVFEGAWSAMRWHQVTNGEITTLALIGTNANDDTLELLNNVENVRFILDNDPESKAGEGVYERIINNSKYNKQLGWKFILPPEYPDEMSDKNIMRILHAYGNMG